MEGGDMRTKENVITRREAIVTASAGVLAAAVPATAAASEEAPMTELKDRYEVIVVGGGPAGLSAALVLGRACRSVLLCDSGKGRNAPAEGVHGFLGQDGTPPSELRRVGREQLRPYDVTMHDGKVVDARKAEGGFDVVLEGGRTVSCRKLILATGVTDVLPESPGLRELWGKSVIHCPYCHGWEFRGRRWAFLVPADTVVETATLLSGWTTKLTLLTNGPSEVSAEHRAWLEGRAVEIVEGRIERLEGDGDELKAIHVEGGRRLDRDVLFVHGRLRQASDLAVRLGCSLVDTGPKAGVVKADPFGATEVEGLYVAGDASESGVPSVASAVAEGAVAAAFACRAIFTEDARRPPGGPVRRG
ncbi:MAG: reductase [Planctomycetales bacterium 71-10]|nr:MAG: reductase [Planctomycetales bacterium 71-10]